MSISLKGQTAIDVAKKAMHERTEIEIFGMKYHVVEVTTVEKSVTDSVFGLAELMCITRHADVRGK